VTAIIAAPGSTVRYVGGFLVAVSDIAVSDIGRVLQRACSAGGRTLSPVAEPADPQCGQLLLREAADEQAEQSLELLAVGFGQLIEHIGHRRAAGVEHGVGAVAPGAGEA
jgi:hypothetical protein